MNNRNIQSFAKEALHFVLFSNWWVSFSLSGLALGYGSFHGIKDAWTFAAFALAGTYFTYNFHRMVRMDHFRGENIPPRILWQKNHRTGLFITTILAGIIGAITFFMLPIHWKGMVSLALSGFIVFFYVLPIPILKIRLRNIPMAKDILIAVVWILLLIVPELNRNIPIDPILTLLTGIWIYVQIIPFDIRDLSYDPSHLKTLPQLTGPLVARIICTAFTIFFAAELIVRYGFHWMLIAAATVSQLGMWWKQTPANKEWLELLWDGNLMLTGLYLYFISTA